jgi:hypothetical protein
MESAGELWLLDESLHQRHRQDSLVDSAGLVRRIWLAGYGSVDHWRLPANDQGILIPLLITGPRSQFLELGRSI